MKKLVLCLSTAAAIALSPLAVAHHSGTQFDSDKTVSIQGTVKAFHYTNPHSWLMVIAKRPDGSTTEWVFESEGPSTLMRDGIELKTFQPGDGVTVVAHPMRDGRPAGLLVSATKADGTVYKVRELLSR